MKTIVQLIFLIALLVVGLFVHGQDVNTDWKRAKEYYYRGQYAEAAELFEKWLPAINKIYEKNDTSFFLILISWTGVSYHHAGALDKAEPLLVEAKKIAKKSFGENHPEYSKSLNNLSQLYQDMGKYEDAETLIKEAIRIDKETIGENNSNYGRHLNSVCP